MKRNNPFNEIYKKCNNKGEIPLFPRLIDIELTNCCNYHCLMCPTGIGSMKREKGFMSEEIYTKIIDEIVPYSAGLRFIRWGEPTLHKNFFDFLALAKKNKIICHFNTNGLLLTKESIQQIIDLKIESVKFSFQGIDRKSYLEMRNKDAFEDLLGKIKLFYNLRGNSEYPYIHVSTTTTYESEQQISEFKNRILPYVDLITVGKTNLSYVESEHSSLNNEERERLRILKEKATLAYKHKSICPEVFAKLSVNWDGRVSACCADYDNFMIVGDLRKSNLKEIWNNDKLNYYRSVIQNKEYEKLHLCKTCFDYIELKK